MRIENNTNAVKMQMQPAKNESVDASVKKEELLEWEFHTTFGNGASTFEILCDGAKPTPREEINDADAAKQAAISAAGMMTENADDAKRAQANAEAADVLSLITKAGEE